MPVVTTGQITIVDQNDGVSVKLSLESFVAPTASDGTSPNLTGASTTLTVFLGNSNDSANWTVAASPSIGVSGSLVGRTYTVTALTVDAGFVDLTATRNGYDSVTARFAVSKVKKGNRGTVTTARAITTTAWADAEATVAISNVSGDAPVDGDMVTLYNSTSSYSETRRRVSGAWVTQTAFFGGDVLVDDSITTSKVRQEDNSNLTPDADYEDASAWVAGNGTSTVVIVASSAEWNSANIMQVSNISSVAGIAQGKPFKVRPGDKIFWEGQMQVSAGSGSCFYQIQFSATRNMASSSTINLGLAPYAAPTTVSGEFTVPAGVRFARVRCIKNSNGALTALFGRLTLRKKTDAELLTSGAVDTANMVESAVNDIERAYDVTGVTVSSATTRSNLLKMRLERFSGYVLDLDVDCIFEAWGNCMVVLDVFREGVGAAIIEENVFQSIGGRISKASFLVTDFAPTSGLQTYVIRGRLAHSDARGGFNAPATIKQIQVIARQIKR